MRNLKRALSLALASVMLLGMMVVGTSASFPDVDAQDNETAINVAQALGLFEGDDEGNFNPDQKVNRNQMAVVMTHLLDLNYKDYAGTSPFTDVPAWAEPFVAACYANKIVSGTSATTYGGNGTVTTAEASLMVMKALGYFQYGSDFEDDWRLATIKQGSRIGLYDGISSNANSKMTRNDVAQLVLNGLESKVVYAIVSGSTTEVEAGDVSVTVTPNVTYHVDTNGFDYDYTNDTNDGDLYLCEKLFGSDLKKSLDHDKYGRPGTEWTFGKKNDQVAFTADETMAVYTAADFDEDAAKKLAEDYTVEYVYNGEVDAVNYNATTMVGLKGSNVEVYEIDEDDARVVVIEGYMTKVADITTNDDDEVTSVSLDVYEAGYVRANNAPKTITVSVEDNKDAYALVKDFAKDDVFMGFWKNGFDTKGADALMDVEDELETVKGAITSTSLKAAFSDSWIKVDGVKYEFSNEYARQAVKVDDEGTFYLYNGYIVYADTTVAEADPEYAYVIRLGSKQDNVFDTNTYAELLFIDGTTAIVKYEAGKVNNVVEIIQNQTVVSYTVKDEVYTLKNAGDDSSATTITKGQANLDGTYYANDKTIFVAYNLKQNGTLDSAKTYTGIKNIPSMTGLSDVVVIQKDNKASVVFFDAGVEVADNKDLIYVAGATGSGLITEKVGDDTIEYYTYKAVVDGKIVDIKADAAYAGLYNESKLGDNDIYSFTQKVVAETNTIKFVTDNANETSFEKAADGVVKINSAAYTYAEDMKVFVVDGSNLKAGSINKNYDGAGFFTLNGDGQVTALYIVLPVQP